MSLFAKNVPQRNGKGFKLGLADVRFVLVWLTGALTVASLAAYLRSWLLHMSGYEQPGAAE